MPNNPNWDLDYLDFPTAWHIQKKHLTEADHNPKCSSVPGWHPLSGPGLLCDCGAVQKAWERIRSANVEGGEEGGS